MNNKICALLIALNAGCCVFNIVMGNWETAVINIAALLVLGLLIWLAD